MYPEFIAIYIGLGILAVLQILSIILVIILIVKTKKQTAHLNSLSDQWGLRVDRQKSFGVVFCVNCGTQFDPVHNVCPKCGKPRK